MDVPLPRFTPKQRVRILTPLAKTKWGVIQAAFLGNLERSTIQKISFPKQVIGYWVKCGPQGFVHGYYEHELELLK